MFIAVLTLSGVGYPFAQLQAYFLPAMDHVAALLIVLCFPTQYITTKNQAIGLDQTYHLPFHPVLMRASVPGATVAGTFNLYQ